MKIKPSRSGAITLLFTDVGTCKLCPSAKSDFLRGFYFRETLLMQGFLKIQPSRSSVITLWATDVGKSCPCHRLCQICILTIFAKIKFSRKFPNLQYMRKFNNWTYTAS